MIVFDPSGHPSAKCQGMLSSLIVPRPIAMITTVGEDGTVSLYEIRRKIYPRAVTGWFATLRWAATLCRCPVLPNSQAEIRAAAR